MAAYDIADGGRRQQVLGPTEPFTDSEGFVDVDDDGEAKSHDDDVSEAESEESNVRVNNTCRDRQKKTRGRVKIDIELIRHKQKRSATFHKRKGGLMKKVSPRQD